MSKTLIITQFFNCRPCVPKKSDLMSLITVTPLETVEARTTWTFPQVYNDLKFVQFEPEEGLTRYNIAAKAVSQKLSHQIDEMIQQWKIEGSEKFLSLLPVLEKASEQIKDNEDYGAIQRPMLMCMM